MTDIKKFSDDKLMNEIDKAEMLLDRKKEVYNRMKSDCAASGRYIDPVEFRDTESASKKAGTWHQCLLRERSRRKKAEKQANIDAAKGIEQRFFTAAHRTLSERKFNKILELARSMD